MKKITSVYFILLGLLLCGCQSEETQSRFLLDTVVTLTADCDGETLDGAFELCEEYDRLFSRTDEKSEIYRLNNSSGFCEVSSDTVRLLQRSLYFSQLSGGRLDVTICPVSELWDFKNQIVPERDEISEALKSVDYESIEIKENSVKLNGKRVDLGATAKGYIADRLREYFAEQGVRSGIINLGGNVSVFGGEYRVGIQRPFGEDTVAVLNITDKSAVTSGIYQRYIERDGRLYHHILDPETGYGVDNELASVTVVGECSLDCDALSTACMLMGTEKAKALIEAIPDTEAVFIDKNENITLTDGLRIKNNRIYFK